MCQDVPYKTLLLSIRDTAANVVKEMLDKYGLHREDPANYCLIQVRYILLLLYFLIRYFFCYCLIKNGDESLKKELSVWTLKILVIKVILTEIKSKEK